MGRAPGDERLDAERGQPPAQGLVAAGRGVLGRWFVIGGLCRPPPCQYGSYTLHLFHGCHTTPPLRGRVADSTTDTASCAHTLPDMLPEYSQLLCQRTDSALATDSRTPRHMRCTLYVAALNQGTGLMDQAKHVSTHPLTLNITRTHTNLIHRHRTRYITAQRDHLRNYRAEVAVDRGAPSGHLGSAARQPSHPNLPGSPSRSRRSRPRWKTGCGRTLRPAAA